MDHHQLIKEECVKHFKSEPSKITKLYSLTNWVYKVDFENAPSIVFKVLNKKTTNPFLFRSQETEKLIDETHFFGDVQIVKNDVYKIERFVINKPITVQDLRSLPTRVFIMKAISRLHLLLPPKPKQNALIFDTWQNVMPQVREKIKSNYAGTELEEKVKEIIAAYDDYILKQLLPNPIYSDCVMCHNDLLHGNLLFDTQHQKYILIDFEYSGYSDPITDIYNLLIESTYDYDDNAPNGLLQDPDSFGNDADVKELIRFYLFFIKNQELIKDRPDDAESLEFYRQHPKFKEISSEEVDYLFAKMFFVGNIQNVYWCVWALTMKHRDDLVMNITNFALKRYDDFIRCNKKREEVWAQKPIQ